MNLGGVGMLGKIVDRLLTDKATGTLENEIIGALSHR